MDYIQRDCFDYLDAPVIRVHQADVPMPYAKNLETRRQARRCRRRSPRFAKSCTSTELSPMATKVFMEALSPTMEEGRLVKWLKNEGDAVKSGEPLAEVETDKAIMELVARGDGVLRKRLVNEGESRPVGTLVGVIAAADENIDALVAGAGAPAPLRPRRRRRSRPQHRRRLAVPGSRRSRRARPSTPPAAAAAAARAASAAAPPAPARPAAHHAGSGGRRSLLSARAPARLRARARPRAVRAPARAAASSSATSKPLPPRRRRAARRRCSRAERPGHPA